MDIKSLPAFSTILAPSHQHGFLRVLFSSDPQYANITILSVEQWLVKETAKLDRIEEVFTLKQATQSLLTKYPSFASRLQDPAFLSECIAFCELLITYQIDFEELPTTDEEHRAMKEILMITKQLPLHVLDVQAALQTKDFASLPLPIIMNTSYSPLEQQIVDTLIAHGAQFVDTKETMPEVSFFHTFNMRQEVEACAQYLLNNQYLASDCTLLLSDEQTLPFVRQIFNHYQIPYTIIQERKKDPVMQMAIHVIRYIVTPSDDHFLTLLSSDLFNHPYLSQFIDYIQLFDVDFKQPFHHIRDVQTTSELISEQDKERLNRLEEHAEEARVAIMGWLSQLLNATSIQDILMATYALLYEHMSPTTKQLQQLQKLFQNSFPYIQNNDDFLFLLKYMEGTNTNQKADEYLGVIISTIHQPLPYRPNLFVLGCTQNNYPAFPVRKGTFDEAYVEHFAFPSMKERYQTHLESLETSLKNCDHLILFYPQGDFAGKGQEASLEIELFADKKAIAYPLPDVHQSKPLKPILQPSTAKQLFVKDGMMKGSISALERYINCPFSYFLKYGLKIREPLDNTFRENRIGTLAHYVLETLVSKYGKAYTAVDPQELRATIHQELIQDSMIYNTMKEKFTVLEERLFQNLTTMFELLHDMEAHSSFQPFQCEYSFLYEIPVDEETKLVLKGVIDRLDVCQDMIRIIDYKSSNKQLSEAKVFAAKQLQLLTYALIAQDTFQKQPVGAYYYSLKSENITADAGKMKRRPVEFIPYNHMDYQDQKSKAQRLEGWTFTLDGTSLDDNGQHIKGFSLNKDEQVNIRKVYDIDGLRNVVFEMMRIIAKRLQEGDIALEPSQDACLYCTYHPICRFKGQCFEKHTLVEPDESIYQKGGKSYDDLES